MKNNLNKQSKKAASAAKQDVIELTTFRYLRVVNWLIDEKKQRHWHFLSILIHKCQIKARKFCEKIWVNFFVIYLKT